MNQSPVATLPLNAEQAAYLRALIGDDLSRLDDDDAEFGGGDQQERAAAESILAMLP